MLLPPAVCAGCVAFQQFADDVRSAIVEANVINGNDVGMIQRGCRAGFQFETAEMIRIVAGGGADQFQSDIAAQPFISRPKNLAHGSGANFLEDSVVTYDLASHTLRQPCWHVRGVRPLPSITRSGHRTCPMGVTRAGAFSTESHDWRNHDVL